MGIRPSAILFICLAAAGCDSGRAGEGLPPALVDAEIRLDPLVAPRIAEQVAAVERAPADASAHGLLGVIYEANELWEPAQRAYENAARLDPERPEWSHHAALCQMETAASGPARRRFAEVARRFPRFAPGRHWHGISLLEDGDLAGAERELTAAAELAKTIPEAHAALAELRNAEGRFADALVHADRALELDTRSRRARYQRGIALRGLGRMDEAAAELAAGSEARRLRLPDGLDAALARNRVGLSGQVSRGADLVEAGRFDEAIALLRAALAERPGDPSLANNLAVAYQRKGDPERAYEVLRDQYRRDPDDVTTLLNLAETLWSLRRYEEELVIADRVVRIDPQNGNAHFARAKALLALQRFPEGIEECRIAIERAPLKAEAYAAAGEALLRLDRLEEAEERLGRAVELDAGPLPPRANLCLVLIRRGKLDEAEPHLRALTELAPDHPQVRILQDRYTEARRGGQGAAEDGATGSVDGGGG